MILHSNNRRRYAMLSSLSLCAAGLALLMHVGLAAYALAQIPPTPADRDFLHDLAGIIDDDREQRIRALQSETFQQVGAPIVVVTVSSMQPYDPGSPSIESFARRWFDTWKIGTQERNNGILLIVSSGDRKARIELGAQWGRRFDAYAQRIMDREIIPRFKSGDYGGGILAGVERLSEMAKAGPDAAPPEPSLVERLQHNELTQFTSQDNPIARNFGPLAPWLLILAGIGCLVAAYFLPEHRKMLVIAGLALIGLALFFWLVLILFAIYSRLFGGGGRGRGGRGGFGGGGGGFGGGFGGGSSGGGGASGSW